MKLQTTMELIAGSLMAALLVVTVTYTLFPTNIGSTLIGAEILRSLVIVCIALIGIIVILIFIISRFIVNPIKALSKSIQSLSVENSRLEIDPKLRRAKGEMGNLVDSLILMTKNMETYQQKLRENIIVLRHELQVSKQRENQMQEQIAGLVPIDRFILEALECETEEKLVQIFLDLAAELTHSTFGFVVGANGTGDLDIIGCDNSHLNVLHRPRCFRFDISAHVPICVAQSDVIRDGKSVIADLSLPRLGNMTTAASHSPITSFLGVPLYYAGKTIGMIGLCCGDAGYRSSHQVAIETLSTTFVEILMHKRAEKVMREEVLGYVSLIESGIATIQPMNDKEQLVSLQIPWEIYTGQSQEELPDWGWLQAIHSEDREKVREIWTRSDMNQEGDDPAGRIWCSVTGQYYPFTVSSIPNHDVGPLADIDCEDPAEMLRQKAEALTRSNAELEHFAYVASHDLQEPLRKIQAFTDRLASKYKQALDEQGNDYMQRVQNAAQRMQTLINDLLTFSRVTTKAQPFVQVDLAEVVQEVVVDLETRIERTGGRVEIGALPVIDADPLQIRQLLQNLIGNGLKFHKEEESPIVKVYTKSVNGTCQILVQDNGIGFDEKYLDRIFAIFQRLHGRLEYEGTGIGLAVCRRIAERHGGNITAKSAPGQGATFIAALPTSQSRGESY